MFEIPEFHEGSEELIKYELELAHVLESLNEGELRLFLQKYKFEAPNDLDTFWTGVHIARALCLRVSRDKRGDSAAWLSNKGIDLRDYLG